MVSMRDQLRKAAGLLALAAAACVRAPSANVDAAPTTKAGGIAMTIPVAPSEYPLCPCAVTGAATEVQDVEGGLILDVTASDAATSAEVRSRADALVASLAAMGQGRFLEDDDDASYGRCPVVLRSATISVRPLDRGVRLVVLADAAEVEGMRRETRARILELRLPSSSRGIGLDHCPSSLPGTTTDVRDAEGGVAITVTSRDTDVAEAIRGRAWHLAHEAGRPGGHAERGLRSGSKRCPVVLDGTAVEARDVPGGAELTVRASVADAVPALRREVASRVAAFH
jgi:hypothetical protein